MDCAYCGHKIPPGVMDCPRCGGPAVASTQPGQVVASAPPTPVPAGPLPMGARGSGQVFTSAPTGEDLAAAAAAPVPPQAADPQAALMTQLVSGDRQEALETKIVEPPPPAKPADQAPAQPVGLPDSRVARGVEDSLLEVKRFFFRLGRIGRLALFSHAIVIIGAVCPWYYVPHDGYTPGIERWGWLPLALSLGGIGTLLWRFRLKTGARVLPVLLHLALAAGLVLSLLWIYQTNAQMPDHLRPQLSAGIYISAAGAVGAALGSLIGLKDVR